MNITKIHQLTAHSAALYALAPGNKSHTLFSAGADRVVAEWDLILGETIPFAIRTEASVYSLLHINSQLVIGTSNGSMHVIDLITKNEVRHLKLHDKALFDLFVDSAHERVYASCADGSVSVWNTADWSLLWHLKLTTKKIRRVAQNKDATLTAIACGDGRCVVLENKSHSIVFEFDAHEESCNSVAFLPSGDLITGGKDAHIRLWNGNDGFRMVKEIPAHNYAIYDILVNESKQRIATASRDKTIKVWDFDFNEKPIRLDRAKMGGHLNSVNRLLAINDNRFASCSDDRSIIIWQIDED